MRYFVVKDRKNIWFGSIFLEIDHAINGLGPITQIASGKVTGSYINVDDDLLVCKNVPKFEIVSKASFYLDVIKFVDNLEEAKALALRYKVMV